MKKLMTFLVVMSCLQTMAQRPTVIIKPLQIPTGKPVINTNTVPVNTTPATKLPGIKQFTPAQMKEQRKREWMLKSAMEKQVAINKILKSTLTKVEIEINTPSTSYISSSQAAFSSRLIQLKGNDGIFLEEDLYGKGQVVEKFYREMYIYSPKKETFYEDLMEGVDVNLDFTDHGGLDFSGVFRLHFHFSDGFMVNFDLQQGKLSDGNAIKAALGTDLHISNKIPGAYFPDPAKPSAWDALDELYNGYHYTTIMPH